MIPSLFTFTILAALALLIIGVPFFLFSEKLEERAKAFPRHRMAGIITMVIGGGWFIWKISQLGQADFGDYKNLLMILFGAVLLGSIFYVRDFLAVRGVGILLLLSANVGLKSAFGHYDIPQRLFLVVVLYLCIIAGLIYGIMPYKGRDTVNWLYRHPFRAKATGAAASVTGLLLMITAFTY